MESLQISKEQCEKAIELMKRIKTLQNNQDFKKVIEECYLKEEPVRSHIATKCNTTAQKVF